MTLDEAVDKATYNSTWAIAEACSKATSPITQTTSNNLSLVINEKVYLATSVTTLHDINVAIYDAQ